MTLARQIGANQLTVDLTRALADQVYRRLGSAYTYAASSGGSVDHFVLVDTRPPSSAGFSPFLNALGFRKLAEQQLGSAHLEQLHRPGPGADFVVASIEVIDKDTDPEEAHQTEASVEPTVDNALRSLAAGDLLDEDEGRAFLNAALAMFGPTTKPARLDVYLAAARRSPGSAWFVANGRFPAVVALHVSDFSAELRMARDIGLVPRVTTGVTEHGPLRTASLVPEPADADFATNGRLETREVPGCGLRLLSRRSVLDPVSSTALNDRYWIQTTLKPDVPLAGCER